MNEVPVGPPRRDNGQGFAYFLRLSLWLGVLSVIWIIFVVVAPINSWFPAATLQASEVDALFKFMLATSGVIFIYVQGYVFGFAIKFRKSRSTPESELGDQIHGNRRLEIAWTIAPSILVTILSILSLKVLSDEHAPRHYRVPQNVLALNVHTFQYGFSFDLPQYGIKGVAPVVIPVNRQVYLAETAADVIHAVWIPHFRVQQDAVPGQVTTEWFKTTETGSYPVICTQLCGTGHSSMAGNVSGGEAYRIIIASEANFVQWVRKHGGKTLPVDSTVAAVVQR